MGARAPVCSGAGVEARDTVAAVTHADAGTAVRGGRPTRAIAPPRRLVQALREHPLRTGFAVYLVAAVALLLPVWLDPAHRWAGPSGDAEQAIWYLGWTPHALLHGWNPLTTTHIGAPVGANLAWNMLMPLPGLLLAPITLLAGPVAAYNFLITLGVALSGLAAMAFLRRHVEHPAAALAGGALYAFGPFMVGQIAGHPNLVAAAAIPPLVLMLVEDLLTGRRGAVRTGVGLGALAAVELLVWEEALATTAVAGAVVLVVLGLLRRDQVTAQLPRVARALGVGVLVAAPLAIPFLVQQFLGANAVHGGIQARGFFVTDLLNPLVPTQTAVLAPAPLTRISDGFTGNVLENDAYLGLPLLMVVAWTARRRWRVLTVRAAALTGGALLILSLGPTLHVAGHDTGITLPWRAVQALPLVGEILPSRLDQYVDLTAALLLAIAADRALRGGTAGTSRLAPLAALAVGVTLLPLLPYPTTPSAVPQFFSGAGVQRIPEGSTALVAPFSHGPHSSTAMLWQATAGFRFRMPEGYYISPDSAGRAMGGPAASELGNDLAQIEATGTAPALDQATISRLRSQMGSWGVTSVVVGPMDHEAETLDFLSAVLHSFSTEVDGVHLWVVGSAS